jgi:hypothetical protein
MPVWLPLAARGEGGDFREGRAILMVSLSGFDQRQSAETELAFFDFKDLTRGSRGKSMEQLVLRLVAVRENQIPELVR